jgi:N-acetylmuramoyl-L-alanine amidase
VVDLKAGKGNAVPIAALILCCLAFLMLSYLACKRLSKMAIATADERPGTIVVDAGHGGEDGGATDKSKRLEKDINLVIAKDLQQLLAASGYRVVMTRTTDTSLSDPLKTIRERKVSDIHNRMKIIESQGNCIFVSIHQNQFEQSRYSGTQVFYSKNNEGSKQLAESIRGRVVALLQKDNTRAVKPATSSIYLLWHAKVPAVLVECGFLSNEEEAEKLNRDDYQHQMAFAIYCGLLDYCGADG